MVVKVLTSQEGYDYLAPYYHQYHKHLDSFTDSKEFESIYTVLARLPYNAKILDLGCGDGRILKRIIDYSYKKFDAKKFGFYGWDISEKMLEECKKNVKAQAVLKQVDIMDKTLCINHGQFDFVVFFFLLVHISDLHYFFIQLWKIMNDGGFVIFNTIRQKDGFLITIEKKKFKIHYFDHSDNDIEDQLIQTGFGIEKKTITEYTTLFHIQKIIK